MAEKRKSRRKQDEEKETPTKEEYAVAKFLRFNIPAKEGRFAGITVMCFFGNKAVEALLHSKWSVSENKTNPLFINRQSCVHYLDRLLVKGLFHRANRIEKKKSDRTKPKKKIKAGSEEETNVEEDKEKKSKKCKKGKKEKESDREGEKTDDTEKKKEEKEEKKEEEKKKKEKKLKLGMHDDQRFLDGDEVYVWIYDPVPVKTFIIGLLMVFGAIALCLFPLWPEEVRIGVYYLSLSGAAFLALILVLFVVRLVLFCAIWMCTLGKHHFWFLPNLNEDVGVIDSFRPLYKHETYTSKAKDAAAEKKLKRNESSGDKEEGETIKTEESVKNGSGDAVSVVVVVIATPTVATITTMRTFGENEENEITTLTTFVKNEENEITTLTTFAENEVNEENDKASSERGGGTESEPSDDQEAFELVDKEDLTEEEEEDEEAGEKENGDQEDDQTETKETTEESRESKKDK